MVILYARSYTPYLWPYPCSKSCSIPMAMLHGLRFIYSLILHTQIHAPWNILYKISFIYRSIFHAFAYHEICSILMAIFYARSHTPYPWPYLYSMVILYAHGHTLCPWPYSMDYALYIAQFCMPKSMRYKKYFMKLALYIAQFFMLLLTIKLASWL